MTENELKAFLDGDELLNSIDIKTLVMDLMTKHTSTDEIVKIFYSRLSEIDMEYLNRFRYMRRN